MILKVLTASSQNTGIPNFTGIRFDKHKFLNPANKKLQEVNNTN